MYTGVFSALFHLRDVVSFGIYDLRFLEHISRAELDTDLTPFAALRDDINLASRNNLLFNVYRNS
jgi:hypothetical protein